MMIADFRSMGLVLPLLLSSPSDQPGPDDVDAKTLDAIVREIELAPSYYAKAMPLGKAEALPKFSAKKLIEYKIAPGQSLDKERKRWKSDKKQYAKDFPLRAAIFDAAELSKPLDLPIYLARQQGLSPKEKAAILMLANPVGVQIFKMEQTLEAMRKADEERTSEKSKRWQANFDFARARLQINIVFLLEYNYMLGQIRNDSLPELLPGDDGWKLTTAPKVTVSERKAKDLAKSTKQLWKKIQDDHPDTPWAYFAQRESERRLGMQWAPNKK